MNKQTTMNNILLYCRRHVYNFKKLLIYDVVTLVLYEYYYFINLYTSPNGNQQ